jgi:shikimate kinase
MGSGKSLVGALVAGLTGADFVDLDRLVERDAGMPIARIFATQGEAAFRRLESGLLPSALAPGAVVALGGGVVTDDDNWALIAERALTVYLQAPFPELWRRVGGDSGRPLLAGRTAADVEELYERRRARYERAAHRVDATRAPGEIAAEVAALWSA